MNLLSAATENQVQESLDHLFRHQAGQMVSVLSRIFGLQYIDSIEDAVQESLVAALNKWPFTGMPENPKAWLIETAKNKMLDRVRRISRFRETSVDANDFDLPAVENCDVHFAGEISEDQLRMIFACCHPSIQPDAQVALTLKIVSGFSIAEIARAFLSKEDAVAKMITRAKQKLRENRVELEMPPAEIPGRLAAAVKVLYLMFNEGYAASEGKDLVRKDLCFEAIRLCEFLAAHPVTDTPKINALAALFLFQGARLSSRYGRLGELIVLEDQDRSLWDKKSIGRALNYLQRSAAGDELTDYHLEAEIAANYAIAETYEDTNWPQILDCCELLQKRNFSPVVELNRITVLGKIYGAERAIKELNASHIDSKLKDNNLYHITRAHFLAETGEMDEAITAYKRAVELTHNEPVRRFLEKKIISLGK
jgi:RNA polymerase sigma factor (sigma-70 family)